MDRPEPADLADVPVFPLPNLVLFPNTSLPLRVFEPRYRAMVADCLQRRDPLMVVAQLRPGFEADYAGRPPIYEVAGLGRVVEQETSPDGTYNLVLKGLARVRATELPAQDTPYRRAELLLLHSRFESKELSASETASLLSMAGRVGRILNTLQPGFELSLPSGAEAAALLDHVANQLLIDARARQEALELLDVGARHRFVMAQLAQLHMALTGAKGDQTLH